MMTRHKILRLVQKPKTR